MRSQKAFFALLKRTDKEKKIHGTRKKPADIFDYIEMFYNSKRRHGSSDKMPPTEYEKPILLHDSASPSSVATQNSVI
ncbi:IS3 family transposase [Salmonella enterica subsp. enterica]|nr:IS3 family transposase [Salmonella enterica subsp. enterica]